MAKNTGGRPKRNEEAGGTLAVRLYDDVAEMISWIVRLEGGSSAKLLDPLIRPQISARYKQIQADVESIKKIESRHRQEAEEE